MKPFIYFRALKLAEHTVFSVEKGQKTYYDPQFDVNLPFASGQQVKRSILETFTRILNVPMSPTTFVFKATSKGLDKEGEVYGTCDPSYPDQLLGGWMKVLGKEKRDKKSKKEASEEDDTTTEDTRALKRRSPLSISAMRPLHPLLGAIRNENLTFDRRDKPEIHHVVVRDSDGNELSDEQIDTLFEDTGRTRFMKWVPKNKRASGLFVHDVAIDLRTLFAVSLNQLEPELSTDVTEKLKAEGWIEGENAFGQCLIMPKEQRDKLIPAIGAAIIHWQLGSNQSRTFSLRETLAIAIGDNANKIAGAIRAKLKEDEEKAIPIVDDTISGVSTYITLQGAGRIRTNTESAEALEQAEQQLIALLSSFDYEHQMQIA